jgi:hypothetical protein
MWQPSLEAFPNSFDNIERLARGEKPFWIVPELRGLLADSKNFRERPPVLPPRGPLAPRFAGRDE